jgi:hypothetical protein
MERKPFLLRLDPATLAALRGWAGDDLRSLNGQIEYLLRRALRDAGRLPATERSGGAARSADDGDQPTDDGMSGGDAAAVPAMQGRGDRR